MWTPRTLGNGGNPFFQVCHGPLMALAAVGTALSAGGTILGGYNAKKAAGGEADAYTAQAAADAQRAKANAAQAQAVASRQAIDQRQQTALLISKARANAAVSGGGNQDPTILHILEGIAGRGDYLARSETYSGASKAAAIMDASRMETANAGYKSAAALYRGQSEFAGSILEGAGQALKGGMDIANSMPASVPGVETENSSLATDPWNTRVR